MAKWQVQRDGYTAEFVQGTHSRPHKPIIRVTGQGLKAPMEWLSNGEDAIDQMNQAIDIAKKGSGDVTRVHFRMIGGEVIALFPDMEESRYRGARIIGSYMHVGQHSAASSELIQELEAAEPSAFADLKAELEGIGYKLEVAP